MNDLDTRNLHYAFTSLTSCIEQQNERKVFSAAYWFFSSTRKHTSLFVIQLVPQNKFPSLSHLRYPCVLYPAQRFSVAVWWTDGQWRRRKKKTTKPSRALHYESVNGYSSIVTFGLFNVEWQDGCILYAADYGTLIPVARRSKALVSSRFIAGIAGSNSASCVCFVLCGYRSLRVAHYFVQRGHNLCVWSRNHNNKVALDWVGL